MNYSNHANSKARRTINEITLNGCGINSHNSEKFRPHKNIAAALMLLAITAICINSGLARGDDTNVISNWFKDWNSTLHPFTSLSKLTTGFRVEWPQSLSPGLPHMEFTQEYAFYFVNGLVLAWPLLGTMALGIGLVGLIVGKRESWEVFDSIYWAFITATTVGYGDIRPLYRLSKALAILIAMQGMAFTGIMVALAINAAQISFERTHQGKDADTAIEELQRPSLMTHD